MTCRPSRSAASDAAQAATDDQPAGRHIHLRQDRGRGKDTGDGPGYRAWLQGKTNSAWPGPGGNEIDFVELWSSPTWSTRACTTRTRSTAPTWARTNAAPEPLWYTSPVNLSADSHLYSLIWEPGPTLTYYVDNKPTCQISLTGNCFNTPMYITIDTAIGASWFGHPDATTPFPQQFNIDFVHVYHDLNLQ